MKVANESQSATYHNFSGRVDHLCVLGSQSVPVRNRRWRDLNCNVFKRSIYFGSNETWAQ